MTPSSRENLVSDNTQNLKQIQNAVRTNLGFSLPLITEIVHHMVAPHHNPTRSLVLLQAASLFKKPDAVIFDIGSTLEFLHTASALHRHIKNPENARRHKRHVRKLWGSEASVLLGDYLLSVSFRILTRVGNLDVLECVSLATQNIARGQVLEISENPLTATPEHWCEVVRRKIAGLFGAGAQSAAYWGSEPDNASEKTLSSLFAFGECVGIATQLKTDLEALEDERLFRQKAGLTLTKQELWFPLCFWLHKCLEKSEYEKFYGQLQNNDFNLPELLNELRKQFKKHEVAKKVRALAEQELQQARTSLEPLKINSGPLEPLTRYSMI